MSCVELRHMSNKNENIEIVPPVLPPLPSYRVRQCSTEKCKCDAHSAPNSLFVRQSIHSRHDEYLIKPTDLASIQEQNRSGHDIQGSYNNIGNLNSRLHIYNSKLQWYSAS